MISSFKKKKRDGFTLVELLVVIAILAVLASVSVIGYLGFTKKAKVSNDVSLTTQMNRILQAEEAGGETFDTPHDAITALKEGGLDVTKLTPTTDGYSYVYDVNGTNGQKMILVDENKNVIAPEGASIDSSKAERYFFFAGTSKEVEDYTNGGYSVYLKDGFTTTAALNVKAGLDVGSNEGINAKYENTTNTAKDVILRTNGGSLEINDKNVNSQQIHYGESDKVEVITGTSCYHEYGKVEVLVAKEGKVIAENGSNVSVAVSQSSATIETKENAVVETKQENVNNDYVNKLLNATAIIGTNAYDSLDGAITGANENDVIKLLKDVSSVSTITINKGLTLDGNGHKLTTSVDTTSILNVSGTGAFTLKNLTVYANKHIYKGSGEAKTGVNSDISINTTGKVVIDGCTFDGVKDAYYNVIEFGVSTAVADGTTFSNNTFNGLSIRHNCINFYKEITNTTIYIKNNTFNKISDYTTNPVRITNTDTVACTINFENNEFNYNSEVTTYAQYCGLFFIQDDSGKGKYMTINVKNLTRDGNLMLENKQGTADQIWYLYYTSVFYSYTDADASFIVNISK